MFFVWTVLLIAFIIYRLAVQEDFSDFILHYTNWSWSFMTVFFLIDLCGRILELMWNSAGSSIRVFNVCIWFWTVNGSAWIVIVIVSIIIQQNPSLLEDAATEQGGPQELGFVTNIHILLHYVPGYFLILFMILERDLIGKSIVLYFRYSDNSYESKTADFLFSVALVYSVLVPFGIYSIIFDAKTIYGFEIHLGLIAFITLLVLFFLNAVPFIIFIENYMHKRTKQK